VSTSRFSGARIWIAVPASLAIVVGIIWDISWHLTIGRDSVFSPPHLAIYGGVLGLGALSAGLLARSTWLDRNEHDRAVGIAGLRAPTGAWVCLWGVAAVLTAVLLDAWWHRAYGLDVTLVSVPHTILATGFMTLILGALMTVLTMQNRDEAPSRQGLQAALAILGGCMIVTVTMTTTIYAARPNDMHSPLFHRVSALSFPVVLAMMVRASRARWAASSTAGVYMGIILLASWILQLVPAAPRVGPILNDVSRMVPPGFPLLLVLPALAYDLVHACCDRGRSGREWLLASGMGILFVVVFGAAQWLMAELLMSPAGRNRFFAADRWPYYEPYGPRRYTWWGTTLDEIARRNIRGLAFELVVIAGIAAISARMGLWSGAWMARLQR